MSAWETRRRRYGPTGHPPIRVSRLRFKAKVLRTQGKVAIVARETLASTASSSSTGTIAHNQEK